MVRCASLILLVALAGCQSDKTGAAYSGAKTVQALAEHPVTPMPMPEACTAHMGRVVPKIGEAWPVVQERWRIVADNRDQQADDCAAWDADRNRLGAP